MGGDSFTKFGSDILLGTADLIDKKISPIQQRFFKELQKQSGDLLSPIPKLLTTKQVVEGFKNLNKITSTSLSNPHIGHYRYLVKLDGNTNSSELIDFNKTMLQVYTTIINAATILGNTLHR